MAEYLTPEIIEGIHFCEPEEEVDRKIGLLANMGCIAVHDVDLTLTINGTDEDLTSFGVLSRRLDSKLKVIDDDLYNLFEQKVRDDTITPSEAEFWWGTTLKLFVLGGLSRSMVEEGGRSMRARPGVQEYSRALRAADIPSAWITAGVRDVCEAFAGEHGIEPDLLLGNKLRYAADGTIIGWDRKTLTHPQNKNELSHGEITRLRQPHSFHGTYRYPGTLLVGDGTKDPQMVSGNNVLRLSVANPHGENDERFLARQKRAGYDIVLREDDLSIPAAIAYRIKEIREDPGQLERKVFPL